jgi:hypothetical protein
MRMYIQISSDSLKEKRLFGEIGIDQILILEFALKKKFVRLWTQLTQDTKY